MSMKVMSISKEELSYEAKKNQKWCADYIINKRGNDIDGAKRGLEDNFLEELILTGEVMRDYLSEISAAQHKAEGLRHEYLRENGWSYSMDTVGFLWLWKKVINNICYAVPEQTALYMQEYIDRKVITFRQSFSSSE